MLKKILIIILSVFLHTTVSGEIKAESEIYRLPNVTYPESYVVSLGFGNLDGDDLTYTGTVTINVNILQDTEIITLNSAVKNITRVRTIGVGPAVKHEVDKDKEILKISCETDGEKFEKDSTVTLRINFDGSINEYPTTQGVYRGIYLDGNSAERYFLAADMKQNYARKVFPCYDEPRFKSIFNMTIMYKSGYQAIFNMDSAQDNDLTNITGLFVRTFDQTSSIPAYKLAFVVADFTFNEFANIQSGLKIRVFSQPEQINNTNFGFSTGISALKKFEDYINATYGWNKLDLISLPQLDFDGVVNQGIIFYREDLFLYDNHVDIAFKKELISRNVVNQICQTFIGSSQTHPWLNKGLCKFYEYYLTQSIHAEMKLNKMFAVEVVQAELKHDSSSLAHPLTPYDESLSKIGKAASVLRMFHHALSEETFRHGLQIFINKISSNPENSEPKDFYESLYAAVNDSTLHVAEMIELWEFQAGYPILNVTRNYNGNNVKFSQKHFMDDMKEGEKSDNLWSIPITYSTKSTPNLLTKPQFWLNHIETEKTIEELKPSDYLIVNVDQTGYYRVMYDEANWIAIAKELDNQNFKDISPNTRAMLIDDAGKFMEMEILDIKIFLDMVKYLKHETDYIPWMSASHSLTFIKRMLSDDSIKLHYDFKKFLQTLVTKVFETYGVKELNDEEHHQKHIRNLAINWACQAHLQSCLTQTAALFNRSIINSVGSISSDLKEAIMCNGAIAGNNATFNFLWESYETSNKASEKSLLLKSIGCIEDKDILQKYIGRYNKVGDDDWFTVIQSVYLNGPTGLKVVMEFLESKSSDFNYFIVKNNAFSRLNLIFHEIAERVVTDEMFNKFSNLLDEYGIYGNPAESLKTIIVNNLEWIKRNSPAIKEFLNSSGRIVISMTVILFGFIVQYFVS